MFCKSLRLLLFTFAIATAALAIPASADSITGPGCGLTLELVNAPVCAGDTQAFSIRVANSGNAAGFTNAGNFANLSLAFRGKNRTAINSGLVGWWNLGDSQTDERDTRVSSDFSGFNNPLLISRSMGRDAFISNCIIGNCWDFENTYGFLPAYAPYINAYNFSKSGGFTVSAWADVLSYGDGTPVIFSGPTLTLGNYQTGWGVQMLDADGVRHSISSVQPAGWYNIVSTWDGANLALYVNGSLKGSLQVTSFTPRNGRLDVGTDLWEGHPFPGLVDEVKVWNRPLSASEISALYNGGKPVNIAGEAANRYMQSSGFYGGNHSFANATDWLSQFIASLNSSAVGNFTALAQNVTLNYTSDYTLNLPPSIQQLNAGDERVFAQSVKTPLVTAANLAYVEARAGQCVARLTIPSCIPKGVALQAFDADISGLPGQKVCTQLKLANPNNAARQVVLSSSGLYPASFSEKNFFIAPQEMKLVQFCVSLPSGADGDSNYQITSTTPFDGNLTTANVRVRAEGQSAFSFNNSYCGANPQVSGSFFADITADNYYPLSQYVSINAQTTNYASICLNPTSGPNSDTTAPSMDIYTIPEGAPYANEPVKIIALASDASNVRSVTVHYSVNGGTYVSNTCSPSSSCSISISGFASGDAVKYYATAEDASAAHNAGDSAIRQFAVSPPRSVDDNAPPQVSVSRSPAGLVNENDFVQLTASASDPNGISTITVYYKVGQNSVSQQPCSASQCTINVGKVSKGTQVSYFAIARDNSASRNQGASDPSSFTSEFAGTTQGTYVGGVDVAINDCNSRAGIPNVKMLMNGNTFFTDSSGLVRIPPGSLGATSTAACGCVPVTPNSRITIPLTIGNVLAPSQDYAASIAGQDEGVEAILEQDQLLGFTQGTKRDLYVNLYTAFPAAQRHSLQLRLKAEPNGEQVYSRDICLDVAAQRAATALVQPNGFVIAQGSSVAAKLILHNTGNAPATFYLAPPNALVTIERESVALGPGERQDIGMKIATTSSTATGSFDDPVAVSYAEGSNSVVAARAALHFQIVRPQDLADRTVISGVDISPPSMFIGTTGHAQALVTVNNNNDYGITDAALYATNLPPGVTLDSTAAFGLAPFEQKRILLRFTAINAMEGEFLSSFKLDSNEGTFTTPLELNVGSRTPGAPLAVTATAYSIPYSFGNGGTQIAIVLGVRNGERGPIFATAYPLDLPRNYSFSSQPASARIASGQESNFTLGLNSPTAPERDFNITLQVRDARGAVANKIVELKPRSQAQSGTNALSALFTLGTSGRQFALAVLVILALGAIAFFIVGNRNFRAAKGKTGR
ncbi:LamG domain-containing protein [Candidatus Micrarchaeota archaeon]|nr:LamG domain-containing protein [Candidatus Micrarchaeota archaeon]